MKKNINSDCLELKNIQYKSMLQKGNTDILVKSVTNDVSNINLLLNNELNENIKESWNKLDKTVKLKKFNEYIKILVKKYNLIDSEEELLKNLLYTNLEKKNLLKNKDVVYQKESGILENIPNLIFNNNNRKFTLKKNVSHVSTLKSLGPTKKNKNVKKDNVKKDNVKKDNLKKDNEKKDNVKKDNVKKDNEKKDNEKN